VDDVFESGFVRRAGRRSGGNSGIGEDDVQLAEIMGKVGEQALAILGNGDVGAISVRFRPQFRDCLIQRLLIAAGDGDFSAFCDEEASCGKTDAAIASRDECLLTREFHDSSCRPPTMMIVIHSI
jgi:hypothetical protein